MGRAPHFCIRMHDREKEILALLLKEWPSVFRDNTDVIRCGIHKVARDYLTKEEYNRVMYGSKKPPLTFHDEIASLLDGKPTSRDGRNNVL